MAAPELDIPGPDGSIFRQAMNGLTDQAFVLLDDTDRVTFWSSGAETMFGRSALDAVGQRLNEVFGEDTRCWELPGDQEDGIAADAGVSKRCWFVLPDGTRRHLVTTATPLRQQSRHVGFALHAHDLGAGDAATDGPPWAPGPMGGPAPETSEHVRELEAQLEAERAARASVDGSRIRQLRGLVAAQEDEKGRIARALREQLGQQLTALQLAVEARAPEQVDGPGELESYLEMIASIGRVLDAIAWELRPAALDGLGLTAVLRSYFQQWSRHAAVRGTFHSGVETERFPVEIEGTLYRIARAALDEAALAGASSVDVLLERRDADVILVVEDNAGAPSHGRTYGLAGIRERAAALGGTVEIEPAPAGGCTVLTRLPLTSSSAVPPVGEGHRIGALDDAAPDGASGAEPTVTAVTRLRARLAELRSAVAARDEFVATAAHELRNPVAPLVFQIRLAIEKGEQLAGANEPIPHDWVQGQFRRVEQRLHRLLETLDRLLDVSRLSSGRVDLQLEPIDLVRAVKEVVGSFDAELVVAQSPLTLDIRSMPTGWWDRVRLEQICRNLLSNAVRFGAGSPIEVAIDADTDFAILQVRDHGVGIAPDQQLRIFERFERGAEQRSGGFGIGLWVVKNLCAAMGGTISVQSTLGEGACFTVMLPRQAPGAADHVPQTDGQHHGSQ